MFGLFERKPKPRELRDLLFGDLPLAEWPPEARENEEEPWAAFGRARAHFEAGRKTEGIAELRQVLGLPGLESRHYLQAWFFLRNEGLEPPEDLAKHLLAVIVEVGLEGGLDTVVAYRDGSARYLNQSGAVIVFDAQDEQIEAKVGALLAAGETVVEQIGPWQGQRPPAPAKGQARINLLTPSGLHFGQADFGTLLHDPLAGPVIASALELMKALIAKTES